MQTAKLKISEIRPYERNPRYTDEAVEALKESIKQCGYISPIVVNEEYTILAGHTRYRALWALGYEEVDCIVVTGLTEEQQRKFRLLDNKTAEIATWDYDRLVEELDGLDFGEFPFFDRETDKIAEKIVKDGEKSNKGRDERKIVICPKCGKVVSGFDPDEYNEEEDSDDEWEDEYDE